MGQQLLGGRGGSALHCLITLLLFSDLEKEDWFFLGPLADNFYGISTAPWTRWVQLSNFPHPGLAKYTFSSTLLTASPTEERLCFLTAIIPSTQQTEAGDERPAVLAYRQTCI